MELPSDIVNAPVVLVPSITLVSAATPHIALVVSATMLTVFVISMLLLLLLLPLALELRDLQTQLLALQAVGL